MNNKAQELEERLAVFAERIILLCKSIEKTELTRSIVVQLIRSATSIGANYLEANNACSRKDFKNKIFICKKESHETKYWLRLIKTSASDKTEVDDLMSECHQFNLIFQKIVSTMNNK